MIQEDSREYLHIISSRGLIVHYIKDWETPFDVISSLNSIGNRQANIRIKLIRLF